MFVLTSLRASHLPRKWFCFSLGRRLYLAVVKVSVLELTEPRSGASSRIDLGDEIVDVVYRAEGQFIILTKSISLYAMQYTKQKFLLISSVVVQSYLPRCLGPHISIDSLGKYLLVHVNIGEYQLIELAQRAFFFSKISRIAIGSDRIVLLDIVIFDTNVYVVNWLESNTGQYQLNKYNCLTVPASLDSVKLSSGTLKVVATDEGITVLSLMEQWHSPVLSKPIDLVKTNIYERELKISEASAIKGTNRLVVVANSVLYIQRSVDSTFEMLFETTGKTLVLGSLNSNRFFIVSETLARIFVLDLDNTTIENEFPNSWVQHSITDLQLIRPEPGGCNESSLYISQGNMENSTFEEIAKGVQCLEVLRQVIGAGKIWLKNILDRLYLFHYGDTKLTCYIVGKGSNGDWLLMCHSINIEALQDLEVIGSKVFLISDQHVFEYLIEQESMQLMFEAKNYPKILASLLTDSTGVFLYKSPYFFEVYSFDKDSTSDRINVPLKSNYSSLIFKNYSSHGTSHYWLIGNDTGDVAYFNVIKSKVCSIERKFEVPLENGIVFRSYETVIILLLDVEGTITILLENLKTLITIASAEPFQKLTKSCLSENGFYCECLSGSFLLILEVLSPVLYTMVRLISTFDVIKEFYDSNKNVYLIGHKEDLSIYKFFPLKSCQLSDTVNSSHENALEEAVVEGQKFKTACNYFITNLVVFESISFETVSRVLNFTGLIKRALYIQKFQLFIIVTLEKLEDIVSSKLHIVRLGTFEVSFSEYLQRETVLDLEYTNYKRIDPKSLKEFEDKTSIVLQKMLMNVLVVLSCTMEKQPDESFKKLNQFTLYRFTKNSMVKGESFTNDSQHYTLKNFGYRTFVSTGEKTGLFRINYKPSTKSFYIAKVFERQVALNFTNQISVIDKTVVLVDVVQGPIQFNISLTRKNSKEDSNQVYTVSDYAVANKYEDYEMELLALIDKIKYIGHRGRTRKFLRLSSDFLVVADSADNLILQSNQEVVGGFDLADNITVLEKVQTSFPYTVEELSENLSYHDEAKIGTEDITVIPLVLIGSLYGGVYIIGFLENSQKAADIKILAEDIAAAKKPVIFDRELKTETQIPQLPLIDCCDWLSSQDHLLRSLAESTKSL